jgi:Peptidase family M28
MRPADTVAGLSEFERRGAGTDAERRAARWLATQIEAAGTRIAQLEPFWCRPNWALAHAWHVALGLAGSLLSVGSPRLGGALILAALLSLVADELTGYSPGRRLTFEHASQNVVASASAAIEATTTIIITANYDAGRTGLVYRDAIKHLIAPLKRLTANRGPGWLGWLAIALAWLLAVAILRLEGSKGTVIGAIQLVPTVALVLALAMLIELASSNYGPGAGDNGSGTAVALALTAALDAAPPHHANVELVLQGASDGSGLGLIQHLRRSNRKPTETIVIGVAACTAGHPRFYLSDGAFFPLRYLPRLAALANDASAADRELQGAPTHGRGTTPALPARRARLPAIAIGCLTNDDVVPRSHHPNDTLTDALSMDDAVQFGLMLVERIDSYLAARSRALEPRPA